MQLCDRSLEGDLPTRTFPVFLNGCRRFFWETLSKNGIIQDCRCAAKTGGHATVDSIVSNGMTEYVEDPKIIRMNANAMITSL